MHPRIRVDTEDESTALPVAGEPRSPEDRKPPPASRLAAVRAFLSRRWKAVLLATPVLLLAAAMVVQLGLRTYHTLHWNRYYRDDRPRALWYPVPTSSTDELCRLHGLRPRSQPRRVVDTFMYFNEAEVLEVRMHELRGVVDATILVESPRTITGVPKRMHFEEEKTTRFAAFADAITHVVFDSNETLPWSREHVQRHEGIRQGLERVGVNAGDIVLANDVDEIPRPEVLRVLKHCDDLPPVVCLDMAFFYLSFEFRHTHNWNAPTAITYDPKEPYPTLRRGSGGMCFANAGWHCSYCFGDAERVLLKLRSNSHAPEKGVLGDQVGTYFALYDDYCRGVDVLDGAWDRFEVQNTLDGLPRYVLENPRKFAFLLPGHCSEDSLARRRWKGDTVAQVFGRMAHSP